MRIPRNYGVYGDQEAVVLAFRLAEKETDENISSREKWNVMSAELR